MEDGTRVGSPNGLPGYVRTFVTRTRSIGMINNRGIFLSRQISQGPTKAITQELEATLGLAITYQVSRCPGRRIGLLDILDQLLPITCMQGRQMIRRPPLNGRLARVFTSPLLLGTIPGGFEGLLLIPSGVVIRPQVIKPLAIRVLKDRHCGSEDDL